MSDLGRARLESSLALFGGHPKSKIQTGRLDFGVWILDFGFRILDFGFWFFNFGFWISGFGFSDFGV